MKARDEAAGSEGDLYRGRIAPTPSGWLHLGHAVTFSTAWQRARRRQGVVIYRTEDLDRIRCRPEYVEGALADLRWWGLDWDEGPDVGGPAGPYVQSLRLAHYREVLGRLAEAGYIYPCSHSRKEVARKASRQSPVDGEPVFPESLRFAGPAPPATGRLLQANWRFRVPDGQPVCFRDGCSGPHRFVAGRDFGDFLVWRKDGFPAYELAVVVDDHRMGITEVVRGEDLLLSTARQLLLYAALGWEPPAWYHGPLVIDPETGRRLSKTHHSLGLRHLRQAGFAPGLPPEAYATTKRT